MNAETIVEIKGLHKAYGALKVLKGVDLSITKGEIVSIVGASGAGKSTLLQIIGTLDNCDAGEVLINGVQLNDLKDNKLAQFRNKNIGFVFQFHHLLPEFTALENVCIPAFIHGKSKKESEQKAEDLLKHLGIWERKDHKPSELSGGEQQRVAIARALMNDPALILADEPSGNLDSKNAEELHKMFFELRDRFNQTFIIVTHNKELAAMSDRLLTMKDGQIVN